MPEVCKRQTAMFEDFKGFLKLEKALKLSISIVCLDLSQISEDGDVNFSLPSSVSVAPPIPSRPRPRSTTPTHMLNITAPVQPKKVYLLLLFFLLFLFTPAVICRKYICENFLARNLYAWREKQSKHEHSYSIFWHVYQ